MNTPIQYLLIKEAKHREPIMPGNPLVICILLLILVMKVYPRCS